MGNQLQVMKLASWLHKFACISRMVAKKLMLQRGKEMAREILLLLNRNDRVEDVIPSLEELAQPGTKVVFLIPYPVNDFGKLIRDH
jgi:hypothetical protein